MKLTIVVWIFLFTLLISCTPQLQEQGNASVSLNESGRDVVEMNETSPRQCGGWICISSSMKGYQLENCSIGQREECVRGCEDGLCTAPVKVGGNCTAGFACKNSYSRAYRTESCTWLNEVKCEFGCVDGECEAKPNETVISSEQTPETETPTVNTLHAGERITIGAYNVSIYLIEDSRVRLLFNTQKTDWLTVGDTYVIGSTTIMIRDILYQPYAGGTQAIEYTLG